MHGAFLCIWTPGHDSEGAGDYMFVMELMGKLMIMVRWIDIALATGQ